MRAPSTVLVLVLLSSALVAGCGKKDSASGTTPATDVPAPVESVPTVPTGTQPLPPPPPPPEDTASAEAVQAYRDYLDQEAAKLVGQTATFVGLLRRGEARKAQQLYRKIRTTYEHLQPAAREVGLDTAMDALEGKSGEGEWTGQHAIEKTLFGIGTTVGTEALAAKLAQDARTLQVEIRTIELDPGTIAAYSDSLAHRSLDRSLTEEGEKYSRGQLYPAYADIQGARAAFRAVKPIIAGNDEQLVGRIESRFATALGVLDSFRTPVEFRLWDEISDADLKAIRDEIEPLQERLAEGFAKLA
jgi:iron uptake system component EfeO